MEIELQINKCYNMDCVDLMRAMQKQGIKADWAICDPPYGIRYDKKTIQKNGKKQGKSLVCRRVYKKSEWDSQRISSETLSLIQNCSANQIIFGGNYYTDMLPPTGAWLVWYKIPEYMRSDFPDCELAYVSKKSVARVLPFLYNGMIVENMKDKHKDRFHPTEKPVGMYTKLLSLYTKPNDLILDPFAGSQSLRIACHKMQRRYIGAEIDKEYFDKGEEWVQREMQQMSIFDVIGNVENNTPPQQIDCLSEN